MNSFLYDTTGAAEILIFRRFNECRVTQNGFILGTKNINVFVIIINPGGKTTNPGKLGTQEFSDMFK